MHSQGELGLLSREHYEAETDRAAEAARQAELAGCWEECAAAFHEMGRLLEKQLRFAEARAAIQMALRIYERTSAQTGVGRCYHSLAVWAFHAGETEQSIRLFKDAVARRKAIGDMLGAAQSSHNLAYVFCRTGNPEEALHYYREARDTLEHVHSSREKKESRKNMGYLFSHLSFTHAKYSAPNAALLAALTYLEHVALTGVHREPFLVYIAVAIALAGKRDDVSAAVLERVAALMRIDPDPQKLFSLALFEERRALVAFAAGSGGRLYLGTLLVTLMEFGKYLLERDVADANGSAMFVEAAALAHERGWKGEVERIIGLAHQCGIPPGRLGVGDAGC